MGTMGASAHYIYALSHDPSTPYHLGMLRCRDSLKLMRVPYRPLLAPSRRLVSLLALQYRGQGAVGSQEARVSQSEDSPGKNFSVCTTRTKWGFLHLMHREIRRHDTVSQGKRGRSLRERVACRVP